MDWSTIKDLPASAVLFGIAIMLMKYFLKQNEETNKYYRDKIEKMTCDNKAEREKTAADNREERTKFLETLNNVVEEKNETKLIIKDMKKKTDKIYDLIEKRCK